jgi:two-component system, NtrC family, response regulator GlrR
MSADLLLVDDDADLLKLISLRLTAGGFRVRTAASGEQALAQLAISRPAVVITDLRMPGMDGMKLFHLINREYPALPVIILTAHGTIPDAVAATQDGVFGYLTKPFDGQELLKIVANAARVSGSADNDGSDGKDELGGLRRHHPQPRDGRPAPPQPLGGRV